MRRSKQEKQQTHERIVRTAARQFRAEGIRGSGIDDLMREAGLTHGGFYGHFRNKDALIEEACVEGYAQTQQKMSQAVEMAPTGGAVAAILKVYLGADHRDDPGAGCILPSLASDVARSSPAVRAAFTQVYREFLEYLVPFLPVTAMAQPEDEALTLLAGMVGTMLLARAIDDAELSERLLMVNRAFYAKVFSNVSPADERIPE